MGIPPAGLDNKEVYHYYPAITTDAELERLYENCGRRAPVMTGTLLAIENARFADYSFNITNSESLGVLSSFGFERAALSPELNAAQIKALAVPGGMQTEVVVYGRTALMTSEHCPLNCGGAQCLIEKNSARLADRKGASFPLMKYPYACRIAVLNSVPLYMADKLGAVEADVLRLDFTIESPADCLEISKLYRSAVSGGEAPPFKGDFTRGHFFRGME